MTEAFDGKQIALKHGRKPRKALKHWLSVNKLVITIVSALTVLAGFVINESLDEPVKDLLSSITVAEHAINHASEDVGLFGQLTAIASDLSLVRTTLIDQKPVDSQALQLAKLRAARIETLTLIGANISALHSQMAVLPRSFRDEESNFEADYQKLFTASGSVADQESSESLTRFSSDWTAMADRSRVLVGIGIQQMENLREASEMRHRIYLWLTYISFILGWTVGLISNVAGESASLSTEPS